MKSQKPLILLLFVFFVIQGCKKSKAPVMPPLTFTGENTFGCYINGTLYESSAQGDWGGGCGGAVATLDEGNYGEPDEYIYIDITANSCFRNEIIRINLNVNYLDTGRYDLLHDPFLNVLQPGNHGVFVTGSERWPTDAYVTNGGKHKGRCHVMKLDTTNNILSGTFEFTAFKESDSTLIVVSDGRFDVEIQNFLN